MKTNIKPTSMSLGQLLREKLDNSMNFTKINCTASGDHAITQRNFIIGSIDSMGNVSVSPNPTLHVGANSARIECKRLAKMYPGKTFVLMQMYGAERTRIEPTQISL